MLAYYTAVANTTENCRYHTAFEVDLLYDNAGKCFGKGVAPCPD